MTQTTDLPPAFVTAAVLAGRLYRAHRTAREMSISAANAKGVAARAGTAAAGFRPITEFIAEMAQGTIDAVQRINRVALGVSRRSVAEQRAATAARRFARSLASVDQGTAQTHLQQQLQALRNQAAAERLAQRAVLADLAGLLADIETRMRGAAIIVTQSRTEASHAGSHAAALNAIAASVEAAAAAIQTEVRASHRLLADLTRQLRQEPDPAHEDHRAA